MNSTNFQSKIEVSEEPLRTPSKRTNRPSQYQKVDENIRQTIIEQVYRKGYPLRQIAHGLGIKYSTAKAILQVYQTEGRIGKKNTRDKRVFTEIQSYMLLINKKSGKIDKIRIKSDSSELRSNLKENQMRLEEEHYSKMADIFEPYMIDGCNMYQPSSEIKELMNVLNEQLQQLQKI